MRNICVAFENLNSVKSIELNFLRKMEIYEFYNQSFLHQPEIFLQILIMILYIMIC